MESTVIRPAAFLLAVLPIDVPSPNATASHIRVTGRLPEARGQAVGLTEAQAIEAARQYLSEAHEDAPVWATMAGTYEEVYASLVHRPSNDEQPPPAGPDRLDDPVWGIQFQVTLDICAPSGACEVRQGLGTLLIGYGNGKLLRQSTIAPSPGDPLPVPVLPTD